MGLSGSGKTQLLYRWKWDKWLEVTPTLSFNVETVRVPLQTVFWWRRRRLCIWDTGGNDSESRPMWRHYMADVDAVVVVIDSADIARLGEAEDECPLRMPATGEQARSAAGLFLQLLVQEDLALVPVLICAHKQDVESSLRASQVRERLRLDEYRHLIRDRAFHLLGTSASTGEGTTEALAWLAAAIDKSKADAKAMPSCILDVLQVTEHDQSASGPKLPVYAFRECGW
eukprot:CAMPEP_0119371388 /NCGR_PEP_ID=MMETSP1334-20130426/17562_1 /TAXON_ID=127549 /ORGANISM="Calcidiscus leptoporus, Strain RCC1130" /LENGTH=228 /DNA_ID=CAMNT_0007388645 /DNA_START=113 /DNA_END=800 /DNA_ORIENTATION=-